jgi:lipopolysaccharide biosynthesis regulator YciM
MAGRALDEDRALALARVLHLSRDRRAARAVIERALREAAAPWRSLLLLADWAIEAGNLDEAARQLEQASLHSGGALEVRRRLFQVKRQLGQHRAALAVVGIHDDQPAGVSMLTGLGPAEAGALALEIAESAVAVERWAAADAYACEALRRFEETGDAERAASAAARLRSIRDRLDARRAAASEPPWIRRRP